MWKRCGSGKPQQTAAAMGVRRSPRGSSDRRQRPQQLLTPYKQEVARSSRAPPIRRATLTRNRP